MKFVFAVPCVQALVFSRGKDHCVEEMKAIWEWWNREKKEKDENGKM